MEGRTGLPHEVRKTVMLFPGGTAEEGVQP